MATVLKFPLPEIAELKPMIELGRQTCADMVATGPALKTADLYLIVMGFIGAAAEAYGQSLHPTDELASYHASAAFQKEVGDQALRSSSAIIADIGPERPNA